MYTALPLIVLYHCMKFYKIPSSSFKIMLRTRKITTDRPTTRPTDDRVTPILPIQTLFVRGRTMALPSKHHYNALNEGT